MYKKWLTSGDPPVSYILTHSPTQYATILNEPNGVVQYVIMYVAI